MGREAEGRVGACKLVEGVACCVLPLIMGVNVV